MQPLKIPSTSSATLSTVAPSFLLHDESSVDKQGDGLFSRRLTGQKRCHDMIAKRSISRLGKPVSEEEIALYDAIERAITNIRAALFAIDHAWVRITAERPNPTASAFAALDTADEVLTVAREDLARARTALAVYTQGRLQQ
jgi:hypothetical protein